MSLSERANETRFLPPPDLNKRLIPFLGYIPEANRQEFLDLFLEAAQWIGWQAFGCITVRDAREITSRVRELAILRRSMAAGQDDTKSFYTQMAYFVKEFKLAAEDLARWAYRQRSDWDERVAEDRAALERNGRYPVKFYQDGGDD